MQRYDVRLLLAIFVIVLINEQSDKEYYIMKIVLNAKEDDHAVLKSEILAKILAKIIRIHQQLEVGAR